MKKLSSKNSLSIIAFIYLLVVFGCQNIDKNSKKLYHLLTTKLHEQKKNKIFPLNGFDKKLNQPIFKLVDFIKLENQNGSSFISKISNVLFYDSTIYIIDKRLANVFAFNRMGQYIFKVGNAGSGPNEYGSVENIFINHQKHSLNLLCNRNRKIFEYSIDSKFITSRDNNELFPYAAFTTFSGNLIFYNNYNLDQYPFNVVLKDSNFQTKSTIFPFNIALQNAGIAFSGNLIQEVDDPLLRTFYFSEAFSSTLFRIKCNDDQIDLYPEYQFDFGSTSIPNEIVRDFGKISAKMLDYSFLNAEFLNMNQHLIFHFQYNGRKNWGILDKEKNECYSFYRIAEKNDYLEWMISGPLIKINRDQFAVTIDSETAIYIKESYGNIFEKGKTLYPDLYATLDSMKPNDNPLLLILSVKAW